MKEIVRNSPGKKSYAAGIIYRKTVISIWLESTGFDDYTEQERGILNFIKENIQPKFP